MAASAMHGPTPGDTTDPGHSPVRLVFRHDTTVPQAVVTCGLLIGLVLSPFLAPFSLSLTGSRAIFQKHRSD